MLILRFVLRFWLVENVYVSLPLLFKYFSNDSNIDVMNRKRLDIHHDNDLNEFSIEKCALLLMKRGNQHMTKGIEQSNQEKIRTRGEKETYKYLGILEADTIKHGEMKGKKMKRIPKENEKTTRNQNT